MSAQANNQKGLEVARDGSLQLALEHFQEAVRMQPENGEFHNNLGVTQMRLGVLPEARQSFLNSLEYLPGYETALDNLKDCEEFLGLPLTYPDKAAAVEETKIYEKFENTNVRGHLKRIHIADLYKTENRVYARGEKPFILVGAMKDWKAQTKWTKKFLKQKLGQSVVDFYPTNMPFADTHPYRVTLLEALEYYDHPTGRYGRPKRGPGGVYIHVNLHLSEWRDLHSDFEPLPVPFEADDYWLDECLSEEFIEHYMQQTHWSIILLGSKNAGMFNHCDVLQTSSWHAHLRGTKRWHICSPDNSPYMYGGGKVDVFSPDYEEFPDFKHAKCTEDDVVAGEILFYPRQYWHQTLCVEDNTMTVTSTVVDRNNFENVINELQAVCETQKYDWKFVDIPGFCQQLERCYEWWRYHWDKSEQEQQTQRFSVYDTSDTSCDAVK